MLNIALAMEAHRNEQASSLNCGFHRGEMGTEEVSFGQPVLLPHSFGCFILVQHIISVLTFLQMFACAS